MGVLGSMKISRRLLLLAGGSVLAIGLISLVNWQAAQQARDRTEHVFVAKDVVADILPPPLYLIEARLVVAQSLDGTLAPDKARSELKRLHDEYDARVAWWTEHPPYGLERHLMGEQHQHAQSFMSRAEQVADLLVKGDEASARAAIPALQASYAQHRAAVDQTVKEATKFASESTAAMDEGASTRAWLMSGVALGALGVFVALAWAVYRSIVDPLNRAIEVARTVAQGDLTSRIEASGRDELSELLRALAQMNEGLTRIVSEVRGSSESIVTGASQIASGNADLSQRTESQASNLQQTAASAEQLNGAVQNNAATAREAVQLAGSASQAAVRGGELVGAVVDTMEGIADSSRKISDIIGVIDGIAFQTNILALNAAVEAARAGEQGRGFAVVAGEVRALAQRSAEAAREIKGLIGASVERVESGSHQVHDAGQAMQGIVDEVRRMSDLLAEMSHANDEQTSGIGQISQAVSQLDEVTQQNAALVEESAAAAESLRQQAVRLTGIVSSFRLA